MKRSEKGPARPCAAFLFHRGLSRSARAAGWRAVVFNFPLISYISMFLTDYSSNIGPGDILDALQFVFQPMRGVPDQWHGLMPGRS